MPTFDPSETIGPTVDPSELLPYFAEVKQSRKLSSGRPFQCTSTIHF